MLVSELGDKLNCVHLTISLFNHAIHIVQQFIELRDWNVKLVVPVNLLFLIPFERVSHKSEDICKLGKNQERNPKDSENQNI